MATNEQNTAADLKYLEGAIKSYLDFPKQGINFRDIFSLYADPKAMHILHKLVDEEVKKLSPKPDCVVGLETRGFLFGPTAALTLNVPFYPIRKKGKLPGKIQSTTYTLEYGEDIVEIQEDYLKQGMKALIIDDLLATGGTAEAACRLLTKVGLTPNHLLIAVELSDLKGRERMPKDLQVKSLIKFD